MVEYIYKMKKGGSVTKLPGLTRKRYTALDIKNKNGTKIIYYCFNGELWEAEVGGSESQLSLSIPGMKCEGKHLHYIKIKVL